MQDGAGAAQADCGGKGPGRRKKGSVQMKKKLQQPFDVSMLPRPPITVDLVSVDEVPEPDDKVNTSVYSVAETKKLWSWHWDLYRGDRQRLLWLYNQIFSRELLGMTKGLDEEVEQVRYELNRRAQILHAFETAAVQRGALQCPEVLAMHLGDIDDLAGPGVDCCVPGKLKLLLSAELRVERFITWIFDLLMGVGGSEHEKIAATSLVTAKSAVHYADATLKRRKMYNIVQEMDTVMYEQNTKSLLARAKKMIRRASESNESDGGGGKSVRRPRKKKEGGHSSSQQSSQTDKSANLRSNSKESTATDLRHRRPTRNEGDIVADARAATVPDAHVKAQLRKRHPSPKVKGSSGTGGDRPQGAKGSRTKHSKVSSMHRIGGEPLRSGVSSDRRSVRRKDGDRHGGDAIVESPRRRPSPRRTAKGIGE